MHPRQLVVEDDVVDVVFLAVVRDFLQLSGADISGLVGAVHPLDELFVARRARRFRQELKFVQVLVDFPFIVILADDADEYSFLFSLVLHLWSKKGHPRADGLLNVFSLDYRSWKITGN